MQSLLRKIRNDVGKYEYNGILYLFRYTSFAVTSVFFLLNEKSDMSMKKIFIVCCICVASVLLNYLYTNHLNNNKVVITILFIETIFNAFILIPTGGLDSPYIWYSLNTILISSLVLNKNIYCWLNLFFYIFSSTWVVSSLFETKGTFNDILIKETNLLLSLFLITGAIQILVSYNRKLKEKNAVLKDANIKILSANKKIKESMNSIMELYEAVHLFTSQSNVNSLLNIIIEYTSKITKSKRVFFIKNKDLSEPISAFSEILGIDEKDFRNKVPIILTCINNIGEIKQINLDGSVYMTVPVKCDSGIFGVLGAEFPLNFDGSDEIDTADQLTFLSELGTMALERFKLEEVNAGLLINDEQNRIANEIHDGVLQKLFTISCGVYSLIKRSEKLSQKKIESELTMIQSTINNAMSDLRSTIYGYSWKKEGTSNFISSIKGYIDSIRIYHGIDVDFIIQGSHELLSTDHKKAFYRILTEGIGNAIRHGDAKKIIVCLNIGVQNVTLEIKDDGIGFDLNALESEHKEGMGVRNIRLLAQSLQGDIKISSEPGKGTAIFVKIPVEKVYKEEFVV